MIDAIQIPTSSKTITKPKQQTTHTNAKLTQYEYNFDTIRMADKDNKKQCDNTGTMLMHDQFNMCTTRKQTRINYKSAIISTVMQQDASIVQHDNNTNATRTQNEHNTNTIPIQYQYNANATPIQHQYITTTRPIRNLIKTITRRTQY